MRKFTCSFGLICTVAAAAFLGACNKNSEKCCDSDKAAVKTDAQATPAATPGCCKDKAAAGSCKDKAAAGQCPSQAK